VEVKLLDMAGRGLRAYSTKESKLEIRRDELPAKGIYMLRINTGVKIEKVKLLVE
jgi:hypothetical protein